jgi:hypothetical protein
MSGALGSVAEVPILETLRLKLRPHRLSDFIYSAAMWADPFVAQYTSGKPLTEEESWTKFLRYAGHWQLLGFGYWAVEEKATGDFIGEIGFADYKRDLQPSLNGMPEIGWVLASPAHPPGADRLHHRSRESCVHPRCAEMRIPGPAARDLQRKACADLYSRSLTPRSASAPGPSRLPIVRAMS